VSLILAAGAFIVEPAGRQVEFLGNTRDETTRRRIAGSIAEFQRGESSEARSYLAKSACFSGRTGDPTFHAASVLFVREENGHSDLLGRFMEEAGIPRIEGSWGDHIFRWLRSMGDIGWASRVLIIAELIAQEYYPCLRACTRHPALVRICDKIIHDEEAHIRFQIERIVRVEAAVGRFGTWLRDWLQIVLMCGAAVMVYAGHRHVLGSRLNAWTFPVRSLARLRLALQAMAVLRDGRATLHPDGVVRLSLER